MSSLQAKVQTLEGKIKSLEDKVADLGVISRLSNLSGKLARRRQKEDACAFLENWLLITF